MKKLLEFVVVLVLIMGIGIKTEAADIYVPGGYATIQAAINAATSGDTVLVDAGTYTENINFSGRAITVKSVHGTASTIIDGNKAGSVITFSSGEGGNSVLDGFTVTNGQAVYNGGGIYCKSSSPLITNCFVSNNLAVSGGGGIRCESSSPQITNCTISSNNATNYNGGGIYCKSLSSPIITNCFISNNLANGFGGGIACDSSSPQIINCTISNNLPVYNGGGIDCDSSSPTVVNSVLWDDNPQEIYLRNGGSITITYSDIKGSWTGTGNINTDPLFAGSGDYHLTANSPCINTGTNAGAPASDIDGDTRPQGIGYDMGADEYKGTSSPAHIIISPINGTVGSIVTVAGNGFGATETVGVRFGMNALIAAVYTTAGGTFTTCFTVDTQPYGSTTIRATGETSLKMAEAAFRILPSISSIQPTMGTVGCIVTIAGNGYMANEQIRLDFGNKIAIASSTSNAAGMFTACFFADTQPYGITSIAARGLTSGIYAAGSFGIKANMTMVMPTQGTIGSVVTIAGNGFGSAETIRVSLGTTPTIATGIASNDGSFMTIFAVNTQPCGITTITARGISTMSEASRCFNIRPNITFISPICGTVGCMVRVMGSGFGATESVRLSFGNVVSISILTTDATGRFDNTFIVNTQAYGTKTIMAAGLMSGQTGSNMFYILPNISSIVPTTGTVGTLVTVSGNGFAVAENVRMDFGNTAAIKQIYSTENGIFTACFTVNTQPYGTTTVRATGLVSNAGDSDVFRIMPTITTVMPNSGTIGSMVTISGNGFAVNESVIVHFGTTRSIIVCMTSADGGFAATFMVDIQPSGTKTIVALGAKSGIATYNTFRMGANIFVIPTYGTVGTMVAVMGAGFGANEVLCINFGTTQAIVTTIPNVFGTFSACFTVDTQPYGKKTITVVGQNSGIMAAATFNIVPNIVFIVPTMGIVGSIVTVSGNGFAASESLRIEFGTTKTIATTVSNVSGAFSARFTVDTQPYGVKTVAAVGMTSNARAERTFAIMPGIVLLTPYMGTVGTMVTMSGNGFAAGELLRIEFGTTKTMVTTVVSASGTFSTYFTVNTQPYGMKTVAAIGMNSGIMAAVAFNILPHIIFVEPTMGTVGSMVAISGNGFAASESLRIEFGTTKTITTAVTNSAGTFTTCFTVNTQPYGKTTIAAIGMTSGITAASAFNIVSNIIFISPIRGTVGTTVMIKGNGFGAAELIRIGFGTTQTITLTNVSAQGSFEAIFTADTQAFGTTTIKARGMQSGEERVYYFFMMPNIVSVNPSEGTVGSIVTIAGNGFGKNEAIRVDFGTTANICTVSSTMNGIFTTVFTTNTQPYGTTSLTASGLATGSQAFALFKIVPKIVQVSPVSGTIGSTVMVSGNGFCASELIRIGFGTTPTITLATTNGNGAFGVTFIVNTQPIGTTTIMAYSSITNANAAAYFVILSSTLLKVIPATQNIAVGSTFTAQVEVVGANQLSTAGMYLSFNPAILEVLSVGTGTLPLDMIMENAYDNINGKIDYAAGLLTGSTTGSGVICSIKFRAKAGGTSSVVFDADIQHNRNTILINASDQEIPFTKQEAVYQVITGIEISPKGTKTAADNKIVYTCLASCGSLTLNVTSSTAFSSNGGGSWTVNSFLAKYMGTYPIQGAYLGFIGTTTINISPGTPTALRYVSGNGQVSTCTCTLKAPFMVKAVDKYENPCNNVNVYWEIRSVPASATGYSISPTMTTTNIQGTASAFLTLGTEPPGTYTIHAVSSGLSGSPCTFTARSLRRFGNIAGFCLLNLGTGTLGTTSDIMVRIVGTGTTTMTNVDSYFIFLNIPVGTYTLILDTWGAAPATKTNVCISPTQVEDTTHIGTMSLLAGDTDNNDGQVNMGDWGKFVDTFGDYEGTPEGSWDKNKEGDFNHSKQVNEWDFVVFGNNFGQQQGYGNNAPRLSPSLASAKVKKATFGEIKLSFDIDTLEGVDVDDLRIGNKIYLEINISDAQNYLGGEVHLSFNPAVLQVVDTDEKKEGIQIQRGNFPQLTGVLFGVLKNEADNLAGKIDYAVVVWKPETRDGGLLAIVPFEIISCGNSSKVGFDFDDTENRQTMFVERAGESHSSDQSPEIAAAEMVIKVPLVFNNLERALVYPNPVSKGGKVTFDNLPNKEPIKLKIFNIAGELVYEGEPTSVPTTIEWNLRNKDNEDVASGTYLYLLEYQGLTKRGKIGVIK